MSRTPEEQAIAAALAQAERDVACGINPSAEPLRVALHKAVDVIASVSAERDAARAERHDIPHHIRLALTAAQRSFDDRDLRAFGTFNEDLQPVVDAASAWITALSRDLSEARAEARTSRAEMAALRAQVAEAHRAGRVEMREEMQAWADDALGVMMSAAQMNERAAADAARRAERDRCADLVNGWHISKGGYTELAHVLRQDPE